MHPSAIRQSDPVSPDNESSSVGSEHSLRSPAMRPESKALMGSPNAEVLGLVQTLASVATALWRIRRKLDSRTAGELPAGLRHLPRHLDAAWDELRKSGVDLQDLTGQRYVPGMAVQPIAFQPTAGIGIEMVQESVKPAVYFKD